MSVETVFPGINPYLNSYLQDGPWESFHSLHISDLHRALEAVLPEGYASLPEESLQIHRTVMPDAFELSSIGLIPDVTIHRTSSTTLPTSPTPTQPSDTLLLTELQEDIEPLSAVIIYKVTGADLPGKPVTRVELLSPANKPGGSHYQTYLSKRRESLRAGLNLIELDYLHETPPILPKFPSYAAGQDNAVPYRVIVSNPHPSYAQGVANLYNFGVDDPLPNVTLPLDGNDTCVLDLNVPYQRTAYTTRTFLKTMNYSKLPLHFERYHPADQERIRGRVGL